MRNTILIDRAGKVNDQEFTYDQESRITSVTRNGQTVTYAYNGLDTRTSVTMGSTVNTFLRDGAYVTDPVLVDSGATYTPGISERRGMTTTYLHSGLKNAFAQSGTLQNVTAAREYDAFGNVTSGTGAWAGPFGYAGKFGYQSPSIPGTSTPDEGLTLMGHRYYDPSTGRFLTRDPIFDGRNWYSYGGGEGNPLTQADPDGLERFQLRYFREVLALAIQLLLQELPAPNNHGPTHQPPAVERPIQPTPSNGLGKKPKTPGSGGAAGVFGAIGAGLGALAQGMNQMFTHRYRLERHLEHANNPHETEYPGELEGVLP